MSSGDIIIGKYGTLSGNITNIHNLYILGGVMIGNVIVDNVIARSGSIIKGNITCKSLTVEQYVTIIGRANIHSLAPEYIDHNGDIIIDAPEVEVLSLQMLISMPCLQYLFYLDRFTSSTEK